MIKPLEVFQKKEDLLFNQNIAYDSLYFSPRSFNQTMIINVKSKWSKIWTSNISFNYNYYNYGNDIYYQEQFLKQINLQGYHYRLKKINNIQMGMNFSWANGYLNYYQISSNLSARLEIIKNLFFDFNYQFRYRKFDDSSYNNRYFFIKASYNF